MDLNWDSLWSLVLLAAFAGPIVFALSWFENQSNARVFQNVRRKATKGWQVSARRQSRSGKEDKFELFHERWISWFCALTLPALAAIALIPWNVEDLRSDVDPWFDPVRLTAAAVFLLWAIGVLISKDRNLVVRGARVSHHKSFGRTSHFDLLELSEIRPQEESYLLGFDLFFKDGRVLHVGNTMLGLLDLLEHLTQFHPDARIALAEVRRELAEGA